MKYQGSKARIAKYILPIILKDRKEDQLYVEPFVGGANLIDKVSGPRLGADNNKYLIACLKALRDGWEPPYIVSKELYVDVKNNKADYPDFLVGYIGFQMSFGGKFFGGYRTQDKRRKLENNESIDAYNSALRQSGYLVGVEFQCCDYQELYIPDGSIVYCDPPYEGTTKYHCQFNHADFWGWIRELSKRCSVFVSEYSAPDDFECLWRKEIISSLDKKSDREKKGLERLFKLK